MISIRILCAGKIKESFYREAVAEYVKRLGRYAKTEIVEVQDEKTPDVISAAMKERILAKEGERLLSGIKDGDYVCALAINGRSEDSEGLSRHLSSLMSAGRSRIVFVIGGSLGLSGEVLRRADETLSFSRMTFPHQLMRVILTEQLYRAFRIMNNEPYHK